MPAVLLAVLMAVGGAQAAGPSREQIQAAERARAAQAEAQRAAAARAQAAAEEERRLGAQRVAAAARLRALEQRSAQLSDRVHLLAQLRAEAEARLAEAARAVGPFIPMIRRLGQDPTETLLAVDLPANDAIRGALVLRGLTRQLGADVARLRAQQEQIAGLQRDLDGAAPELHRLLSAQDAEAAALDSAIALTIAARRAAEGDAETAQRRAAAEAARAETLRAALARLEAAETERKAREEAQTAALTKPARPEPASRPAAPASVVTSLVTPVAGQMVRGFGDAVEGTASTGMAWQTPPSARVAAPCGGRVVFGAPFRSFGLLAIIDCGRGYHVVLSGLQRLDASVGQSVQQGEPIGVMPSWDPTKLPRRPELMMELRQAGQPVNASSFLTVRG